MITLKRIVALPTLMHWRREVIGAVFGQEAGSRLLVSNRQYYRAHMADGTHMAFVAEMDGHDCGCGGVCFTDELPSPDNPTGRCAYLMNIYVREPYRRKGVARHIVTRLIEEARLHGCGKIYLESTPEARPLYSSLGFTPMQGMMMLT